MEKDNEKLVQCDVKEEKTQPAQAPAAPKKMPYVAPEVKVVSFKVEQGFAGSGIDFFGLNNSGNTEVMNDGGSWDMGHEQSASTEEMSSTDWGTFN